MAPPAPRLAQEGARGAKANEEGIDAYIVELRVKHCDLSQVIIASAWIAAERARLALQRATSLPRAPWATIAEIAADRGVSPNVIAAIVDAAVHRGLLVHDDDQRVTVTAAGHSHAKRSARQ